MKDYVAQVITESVSPVKKKVKDQGKLCNRTIKKIGCGSICPGLPEAVQKHQRLRYRQGLGEPREVPEVITGEIGEQALTESKQNRNQKKQGYREELIWRRPCCFRSGLYSRSQFFYSSTENPWVPFLKLSTAAILDMSPRIFLSFTPEALCLRSAITSLAFKALSTENSLTAR